MKKVEHQEYTIHDFESIEISCQSETLFHINLKLKSGDNIMAGSAQTVDEGIARLNDIFDEEIKALHAGKLMPTYFNKQGQLYPLVFEQFKKKCIVSSTSKIQEFLSENYAAIVAHPIS